MNRTFETAAGDGHAMTLAELRDFLNAVDGLSPLETPAVRISFGGGIKSIKVRETK